MFITLRFSSEAGPGEALSWAASQTPALRQWQARCLVGWRRIQATRPFPRAIAKAKESWPNRDSASDLTWIPSRSLGASEPESEARVPSRWSSESRPNKPLAGATGDSDSAESGTVELLVSKQRIP